MPSTQPFGRRHCIPVIYTRGTYYEVGFDVGRSVASIIQDFLETSWVLNEVFLPAYEKEEGKKAYEATLESVKKNFPQYIRELEGTADGAKVPFHKLFLLHMDLMINSGADEKKCNAPLGHGCSTICLNHKEQAILGHNEDALGDLLNYYYFVSAHIISDKPQGRWGVTEEKFTSLCYAGHLPGYTMSYNYHGLVFSINTLSAKRLFPGKTPRHFITRALLAATNFEQAQQVLRDAGVGAGSGCSLNMTFLQQEGDRLFHNVEMGPATEDDMSQLNVLTISPGEHTMHTNAYLRLPVPEGDNEMKKDSDVRVATLKTFPVPSSKQDVIQMLGDESQKAYNVYRETGCQKSAVTLCTGIFDCNNKTWSIYSGNPSKMEPLLVLPILLKEKTKEHDRANSKCKKCTGNGRL